MLIFFIEVNILLQTKAQYNECSDSYTSLRNAISDCLRGRDFQNFLYAPRQLMVALRLDSPAGTHTPFPTYLIRTATPGS